MPDAGRHIEGLRAEHREDLQIFGAVPDERDSAAQRFGQWCIDHELRLRLSGLSDGVGRPQNGYRYDKADECLGHVCFSLVQLLYCTPGIEATRPPPDRSRQPHHGPRGRAGTACKGRGTDANPYFSRHLNE
jgi:hypothetical protein